MATKGAIELVAEAKEGVENLTPDEVAAEIAGGEVVLVDLREREELEEQGMIAGAIHAPRGMLEFYADPSTPYHRTELERNKRTILYCASGGRSALASKTLQDMGYRDVAHLDGGFKAWAAAGQPTESVGGAEGA